MNTYQEIIKKIRPEIDKAIDFLSKELAKIQTGRATPSLVEDIIVDCFNQKLPLKQLAAISTPALREILIQPWDDSYIEGIVASLSRTGIGANPIVTGNTIRIILPALNEEYRKNLTHIVSEKQEEVRISVKRWREVAWKEIQEKTREGEIREDDKFRAKDELQKLVDEYNKKIKEMGDKKKKELLE